MIIKIIAEIMIENKAYGYNIVYKTFGTHWVIGRFSPYQKYL